MSDINVWFALSLLCTNQYAASVLRAVQHKGKSMASGVKHLPVQEEDQAHVTNKLSWSIPCQTLRKWIYKIHKSVMVALLWSQTRVGGLCRKAELWGDSLCHCKTTPASSNSPLRLTVGLFPSYSFCPNASTHTDSAPTHISMYPYTKIGNNVWAEFVFLTEHAFPLFSSPLPSLPSVPVPTPGYGEHPHHWALAAPTTGPAVCTLAKCCKVKIKTSIWKFSANYCDYSPSPKQPKPPEQFRSRLLTSYM